MRLRKVVDLYPLHGILTHSMLRSIRPKQVGQQVEGHAGFKSSRPELAVNSETVESQHGRFEARAEPGETSC